MEKITVKLLSHTPINIGVQAIKKPYKKEEATLDLFVKVAKILKHESVMEHIVYTFDIDGISRLCLQELARHRIASLTVESTRYTLQHFLKDNYPDLQKYFVFPDFNSEEELILYKANLLNQVNAIKQFYSSTDLNNNYIKYLLPESFRTSLVWTINARSLTNFFKLRLNKNAHPEIRHLASLIKQEVKDQPLFQE